MDRTQNYDTNNSTRRPVPGHPCSPPKTLSIAQAGIGFRVELQLDQYQQRHRYDDAERLHQSDDRIYLGWHALTQGAPLNAPASDNFTTQVIIILSDGLNTQNRWHGNGSSQDTTVNDREALACTNAKATGVVVYTLFVDLGGRAATRRRCRTAQAILTKYFDLTTSGDRERVQPDRHGARQSASLAMRAGAQGEPCASPSSFCNRADPNLGSAL